MRRFHARSKVALGLTGAFLVVCSCTRESSERVEQASPANLQSYTESIRGSDVKFDMVWVPRASIWIGRTEVTWDEYLLFCDFEEARTVPPAWDAKTRPSKPQEDVAPFDRNWGTGRRPAVGMSKNAAVKYCEWLSGNTGHDYRLPSEAEWELACGTTPVPIASAAWCRENSQLKTREVGRLAANALDIHDLFGNLWEYCRDGFSPDEPERAVLKGGSWKEPGATLSPSLRMGFEESWVLADPNVPPGVWWVPDGPHLGFRVARAEGGPPHKK